MPRKHKNEVQVKPPTPDSMDYTLNLPAGTDTSWYDKATPEDAAAALALGANLHAMVQSMKAGEAVSALEAKQAADLAAVRTAADERIAAVQKELDAATAAAAAAQQRQAAVLEIQRNEWMTASAAEKERLVHTHTKRCEEMAAELRLQQERFRALEERRAAVEAARNEDIRVAEDRTRRLLQHALDEKERAVQRAELQLSTLQEALSRQTDEFRVLADLVRKKPATGGAKNKGTEYESIFREKLIAAFGLGDNFSLVDSARSGIGHAGDYLMKWGTHTIMWEVKNYDRPVPTAEVEKFKRDMKENPQVRVGVMISRLTPITGRTASGDREIEFVEGKMLIYLSNFEAMSEETLPSLLLLFRLWWAHAKEETEDTSKQDAIRQVERLHADAARAKIEWRLHKSHLEEGMRWMAERVEETESRLKNALMLLQGTLVTVEAPAEIFRDAGADEKAQRDIQIVLKFAKPEASSSCLLSDLADYVSREKGISRDTARAHIRAVLKDDVIDAPRGKPIRITGLQLLAAPALAAQHGPPHALELVSR